MKKALLTLAAVLGMGFAANADVVAFVADGASCSETVTASAKIENVSGNIIGTTTSYKAGDITINFTKNNTSSSSYVTGNQVRWYANDAVTFTPSNNATITGITMECTTNSYGKVDVTATSNGKKVGTMTNPTSGKTKTWSGSVTTPLTWTNTAQVRFTYITVTYTTGVAPAVAAPTFSQERNTVTIACATEGAEIYYTEDGTEPTAESTKYTEAIEVWQPTDFKAIAIKGEDKSSVADYASTFIFSEAENFTTVLSIADVLGDKVSRTTFELNFPMHVCAQLGGNVWLKDDNYSFMLAFGMSGEYTNGQVISGMTAKYTLYNDAVPELTSVTVTGEVNDGDAVEPVPMTVESLYPSMINYYIILNDVTLSEVNGRNATITQGESTIAAYGYDKTYTYPEEGRYNLVAAVSSYKGNLQLTPIEFQEMGTVETPVIEPTSEGAFDIDTQKIVLTCTTEDAEIYYTLDGTDPDMDSEYYSSPITISELAEFTIKARAYKEGWIPSEIATATYKNVTSVEDVVLGSNEAVEYFNLQGVRVAEPAAGLYIRRQGNKVEKVTVK